MRSFCPTRMTPEARWRAAATAPSTIAAGAWSPPMASTATAGEGGRLKVDTRGGGTRPPAGRLCLVDRPDLPPAVVAAVRAHLVRALRLVALRTLAGVHRRQRIVRPALGSTGLRMASLWIRHRRILSRALSGP